jgi:hypothetical protein
VEGGLEAGAGPGRVAEELRAHVVNATVLVGSVM